MKVSLQCQINKEMRFVAVCPSFPASAPQGKLGTETSNEEIKPTTQKIKLKEVKPAEGVVISDKCRITLKEPLPVAVD